ncbi:hypothetical protein AAVH_23279 [Aphelenchoides avenae]|nr:hypothetical protein AAVH_23279 [Aphelenchus avenae]
MCNTKATDGAAPDVQDRKRKLDDDEYEMVRPEPPVVIVGSGFKKARTEPVLEIRVAKTELVAQVVEELLAQVVAAEAVAQSTVSEAAEASEEPQQDEVEPGYIPWAWTEPQEYYHDWD